MTDEYDDAWDEEARPEPAEKPTNEAPEAAPEPVEAEAPEAPEVPEEPTEPVDDWKAKYEALQAEKERAEQAKVEAEQRWRSLQGMYNSLNEKVEKLSKAPEVSTDDLYEQYEKAVDSGDGKLAASLLREINQVGLTGLSETVSKTATESAAQRLSELEWSLALKETYAEHKMLNPEATEANKQAIALVQNVLNGYVAQGMSDADALRKAAREVLPLFPESVQEAVEPTGTNGTTRHAAETVRGGTLSRPKGKPDPNDYDAAWDET